MVKKTLNHCIALAKDVTTVPFCTYNPKIMYGHDRSN